MEGLISLLETPSAVGSSSGTLSVRAQFGADAAPLQSEAAAGVFQQQLAAILIPATTGAFTIETATGPSAEPSGNAEGVFPNQEPVDTPGLDPAQTEGLVALLLSETSAPNLDVSHLASPLVDVVDLPNSSSDGQVAESNPGVQRFSARGTGFVDPSGEPSVSRSTASQRPLQSVILLGPGDVARAIALPDRPSSVPLFTEPLPVAEGEQRTVFSRIQVVAGTLPGSTEGVGFESAPGQPSGGEPRLYGAPILPSGRDEAVRNRVVDTAVRLSNPSIASDPATSQSVSISQPLAIHNRTAEKQPLIGGNLSNAEDQQSSPVASSDLLAPAPSRSQLGDGQVSKGVLNQQASEAGSELKPLVADAETGDEDSRSSRATSGQRSAERIVTKKLPSGNGPTGPFVKVPQEHVAEGVEPQQTTPLQSHEDAAETSPVSTGPRRPGAPSNIPALQAAATLQAFGNPTGDRVLPALPKEIKTPLLQETVVEQTTLGAETTTKPNEESPTSARESIVQETAPVGERTNEPSAKTEAVAPNRGDSELPDRVQVLQRVAQALRTARINGEQVRMRLHPPELGSLSIEVALREGALTARLEVVTEAARALLLDNLPALRENLAQQNVEIDRFDVDVTADNHGGRTDDGLDRQSGQTSREHPSSPVSRQGAGSAARHEETLESPNPSIPTRGFDVMA